MSSSQHHNSSIIFYPVVYNFQNPQCEKEDLTKKLVFSLIQVKGLQICLRHSQKIDAHHGRFNDTITLPGHLWLWRRLFFGRDNSQLSYPIVGSVLSFNPGSFKNLPMGIY